MIFSMDDRCLICSNRLLHHAKKLLCTICTKGCHLNCISIKESEICSLRIDKNWICMICISTELPFLNIEDDEEYLSAISKKDFFEMHC